MSSENPEISESRKSNIEFFETTLKHTKSESVIVKAILSDNPELSGTEKLLLNALVSTYAYKYLCR